MRLILILALAVAAWGQHEVSIQQQLASIRQQLQSVERQRAAAVKVDALFPRAAPAPVPDASECPPLPKEELGRIVAKAAEFTGITHDLLHAVIEKESAFKPCAISSKGAKGLMQLMPAVIQDFGVDDPFDPEENVQAGSKLLKSLITRFGGDLRLSLAAYNAGLSRVEKEGAVPQIPETTDYVEEILKRLATDARR